MAEIPALGRITTLAQLDKLLVPTGGFVWLFKHSLTCGVSAAAWREFQRFAAHRPDSDAIAVVEIQTAREVSREVAVRTGVRHESPQVLLLRGGVPLWHASHRKISEGALEDAAAAHDLLVAAQAPGR